MGAGKGRQFKRREGEGGNHFSARAAALECLGPVRNWQPKRLCAPISPWEPTAPGEQTLWQSQSELEGRLSTDNNACSVLRIAKGRAWRGLNLAGNPLGVMQPCCLCGYRELALFTTG